MITLDHLTAEEARSDHDVARALISRAGFDAPVDDFICDLDAAGSLEEAGQVVAAHGRRLWRFAVDRAQGRVVAGDLAAGDDRSLYWARLAMVRLLRRIPAPYPLAQADRDALVVVLDRTSRGHDDVSFPTREAARRLLISGFDPFGLERCLATSNPSGAIAIALDGTTLHTRRGPVAIEAVLLPVRWRDLADGIVERAFVSHLADVDGFATIRQGRPGEFHLEVSNGSHRGGSPDNEGASSTGRIPLGTDAPTLQPQPEWTRASLPVEAMARVRLPFPVRVTGGGGDHVSNEVAYRLTLLRDALGLALPGGHIQTPILAGLGPDELTNRAFEANRSAIVRQAGALLAAAVEAL